MIPAGVAVRDELGEGEGLQLADPLAGEAEVLADLAEGHRGIGFEAEPHADDGGFAEVELVDPREDPLQVVGLAQEVVGRADAVVGDDIVDQEAAIVVAPLGALDEVVDPDRLGDNAHLDGLADLLGWSDFVVIAAPHTPETAGLFDAATIARMKPTGYLINIGRGAIVVLDDLVAALRSKAIAGVALDVYEVEPLPADHPLWAFPNAILTPHTAGYSPAIAHRHLETLVENVGRFGRGESLLNVVEKALWL